MVFDDRNNLYQGRCEVTAFDVHTAYWISRWYPVDSESWGLEFSQTKMREVENPHVLGREHREAEPEPGSL